MESVVAIVEENGTPLIERCYREARRELNTETDLLREGLSIMKAKIRVLPKANSADLKSVGGFLKGTKPKQVIIGAEVVQALVPGCPPAKHRSRVLARERRAAFAAFTETRDCDRLGRIAA